jgi:hypothetical protein
MKVVVRDSIYVFKIYFNKIIFVEVFDCCVTSQAHQNGCLGIQ